MKHTFALMWSRAIEASLVAVIVPMTAAAAVGPAVQDVPPATLQVRPGSQQLFDEIQANMERIRTRTERLAQRAARGDDLKGKSDSLRKEIVDLYRAVHATELLCDDLMLRGERAGELLRDRATKLTEPLDAAVNAVRPSLGTPTGLANAATRRAKEQLGSLKQLDELVKQRKWTAAHQKLEDLFEAADEVGHFPESAEADPLWRPLNEHVPQVRTGYMAERRQTFLDALRDEYRQARPDVEALRKRLAAATESARESRDLNWDERATTGPELLATIAEQWAETDRAVLQALAVVYAIGPSANSHLHSLQSDYEAARTQAIALARELILSDARSQDSAGAEARYMAYIAVIPRFMNALHASIEQSLVPSTALNQLASRSPEFEKRVRAYRAATAGAFRWRERMARRYRDKFSEAVPAETLDKLVASPPMRSDDASGAPLLPGEAPRAGQRRVNQMTWSIDQSPESVAERWSKEWSGTTARFAATTVRWPNSGNPTLVTAWNGRVVGEVDYSRPTLLEPIERLAKDLLLSPSRPAISLEAAVAMHSAVHGPYLELGGTVEHATLDNLSDRLFAIHDSADVLGSLSAATLSDYPAIPALVRIQFKPNWLVHGLFAQNESAPASTATSPAVAPREPTQAQNPPPQNTPQQDVPPKSPQNQPTPAAPTGAGAPTKAAPGAAPAPKQESPPKTAPGGVRF